MYHGNVRNKMPHGEGTLRTLDGQNSLYEGQWADGKRDGKGKQYAPCQLGKETKICLVYEGDFVNGKRHGQGKAFYEWHGPVLWFDGEWRDGLAYSGTLFRDGDGVGQKNADGSPRWPIKPIRWQAGQKIPNTDLCGWGYALHQCLRDQGVSGYFPAGAL